MKCIICDNEFVAKRADARFCSASCRVKAGRMTATEIIIKDSSLPTPEKIKKEIPTEQMTPDGQVRLQWDGNHPIPNLDGGYLHIGQTQEEYVKNIPEVGFLKNGKLCPHPADIQLYSRCLDCGAIIPWKKVSRKYLSKEFCKKHDFTLKSSCGCK